MSSVVGAAVLRGREVRERADRAIRGALDSPFGAESARALGRRATAAWRRRTR